MKRLALDDPKQSPIALIGETEHDAREVMVEGVSGLLPAHKSDERPTWIPSRRRIEWANGAVAQVFSAEDPESLRGPQFAAAWCDELAKWRHAEATFDMLQFGLRLGERPRQVITTTPRPIALLKRLIADPKTALTHAPTVANARNLAPTFLDVVVGRYAGTKLGRQELDGEIVEERADALWSRGGIENCRVAGMPGVRADAAARAVDRPRRRHQRLCQPVCPFDGVFRRSFRRFGRLCHRPDAGKAGRRDRGTAADPDRRIAQGGQEQEEVMGRSSDIHRPIPKTAAMMRTLVIAAALTALSAPALAAPDEDHACLSKAEQRAALSSGQTVTLAAAIRSVRGSVRGRGSREVVKARLCREQNGLVYLLTLLTRDGKVTHTAVDATSGKVVDAR